MSDQPLSAIRRKKIPRQSSQESKPSQESKASQERKEPEERRGAPYRVLEPEEMAAVLLRGPHLLLLPAQPALGLPNPPTLLSPIYHVVTFSYNYPTPPIVAKQKNEEKTDKDNRKY